MQHNGFSRTLNFDACRRFYNNNNNNNIQIYEWSLRITPVPACYAHTLFMYTDCCRAVNLGIQINTYYIVYTKCDLFPSPPPVSSRSPMKRWGGKWVKKIPTFVYTRGDRRTRRWQGEQNGDKICARMNILRRGWSIIIYDANIGSRRVWAF